MEAGAVFHDGVGRHDEDGRRENDLIRQREGLVVEDPESLLVFRVLRLGVVGGGDVAGHHVSALHSTCVSPTLYTLNLEA